MRLTADDGIKMEREAPDTPTLPPPRACPQGPGDAQQGMEAQVNQQQSSPVPRVLGEGAGLSGTQAGLDSIRAGSDTAEDPS